MHVNLSRPYILMPQVISWNAQFSFKGFEQFGWGTEWKDFHESFVQLEEYSVIILKPKL